MRKISAHRWIQVWLVLLPAAIAWASAVDRADRPGWVRREVNQPMSAVARVRAISYPQGRCPPLLCEQVGGRPARPHKDVLQTKAASGVVPLTMQAADPISAAVVDSPALGGFLSWITVTVTDERSGELEMDAVPSSSVIGNYLTPAPETDYAVAIFDTGASAHVMGSTDAARLGLIDHSLVTSNVIQLMGVTGIVNALVSQPLGVFIDGLGAIEPNGLLLDDSAMLGQTNASIIVGDPVESPDLLTTIGTPLSVYLAAVIRNDRPITITRDGTKLLAPDIRFYAHDDPDVPSYGSEIPLELRPLGAVAVQYFPNIFDPFDPDFGAPLSPSVITGLLPTQSLFFVSSVDLADGGRSAVDKDGFMFDTGSTYTFVSEPIGARLGLNPNAPEFELEILIATGETIIAPGYYIDSLDLVATPQWLRFTNVPVFMFDAPSPEGGILDGIIGTNLFVDFNLVFRGGGLPGQGQPRLEFEPILPRIVGDIAPGAGDGVVNSLDLAALAEAWLTNSESFNWNPRADIAPPRPDGMVNLFDLAALADHWLESSAP